MSIFRPNDTPLDKIALVFVLIILGLLVVAALIGFFLILWSINPLLAIVSTLFILAVTYITRGSRGPRA